MPSTFQIFKDIDSKIVKSLKAIAAECEAPGEARLTFSLVDGMNINIIAQLEDIDKNESLNQILKAKAGIINTTTLALPNLHNSSIQVKRGETSDIVTVNISTQHTDEESVAKLLVSAQKHFRAYVRTESTDKLLGDELAEFYRRREEGLLRLEELSQKLIEDNEKYRHKLDDEHAQFEKDLKKGYDDKETSLSDTFIKKEKKLEKQKEELEAHAKDLDDRGSKHARRAIRQDLKKALADRATEFTLTEKTTKKRNPIHLLFILLLAGIAFFVFEALRSTSGVELTIRLFLGAAGFATTLIYYIRWNDAWFRQHADEEFRLKQLELDIDRASWVVEMAMEWSDDKGSTIPDELIDRLTAGLFQRTDSGNPKPKHPTEDLASALLSASSGLTLKIPGFGEATLNTKGVRQFKKAADKESNNSD